MVRDDFWMAATRFMRELEIRLLEGHNSAAVDLFPTKHARKVLAAFGRAYGTVGESATEKQAGLPRFLDQAIVELSEDAKVVCVRLALFAEMMKGKAWTPASLQQGGGAQGVGVTFLEETFSAATAPPEHRLHQKAARGILKALLPESGADIKGHMRSFGVLLDASGYAGRTKDFHDLIRILNSEIRLITPTDPEGKEQSDEAAAGHVPGERYYQLTHDYLVPSLREWLTRKQKETRKGRAELRLAERAAAWSRKSENRNLPAWWEWLNIRLLTRPHDRTTSQQQMMARADLYYTWRGIAIFTAALAVISAAWVVRRQSIEHSQATIAAEQVRRLLDAETERVPEIIEEIKDFRPWTEPLLKAADAEAVRNEPQSTSEVERARQARRHLHTSLALLPGDPAQVKYLYDRMLSAQPREVAVIAEALESRKKELIDPLWRVVDQPEPGRESQRLRAACALARYDSSSLRWNNTSAPVVSQLVEVDPASLSDWMAGLRPVRRQLVGPLTAVFHDRGPDQVAERSLATSMLADFASDQPDLLAELVMDADEKQFVALFPKVAEHVGAATSRFEVELARPVAEAFSGAERDALAARQANAGVGLLRLGRPERVWLLLKHTPDPSVRSYFIHRLASMGARPQLIVDRLHQERDVSSRIALLLILGEFTGDQLPLSDREALVPTVLQMYRDDPDPGLHGASEWLLHRWEQHPRLAEIDKRLATGQVEGNRGWYINREEQTLVIVRGGVEFFMGSPLAEQGRDFEGPDESQHQRQIDRTYAIATKEVTVEQFLRFRKEHPYNRQYAPTADCPVNHVSWYDAVAYCNWLSKMDDVPPDQWCYAPNDAGEYADGMKLAADYFRLTGYRLPTEAEWEFASRAGAITSRYYGRTEELLAEYAWYVKGPADRRLTPSGSRKPNDWGLFDVLGNAWERCQGRFEDYRIVVDERVGRVIHNGETHALRGGSIFNPSSIRSAHREMDGTTRGHNYIGFRPVRTLLKEGAKEGGSRPIQK
jgi:formylglycine-generating enzyme required for sulfatase activity